MAAVKKSRRTRSQFASLDDTHRQLVYDSAKQRMAASRGQVEAQHDQAQEQQQQQAQAKVKTEARTRATGMGLLKGMGKQSAGDVKDPARRVIEQRARVIDGGGKLPASKPGQGQGVMRKLMVRRSRRRK